MNYLSVPYHHVNLKLLGLVVYDFAMTGLKEVILRMEYSTGWNWFKS